MTSRQEQYRPVIVLSAHTMGLAVIRALGRMGVPVIAIVYDVKEDMGYVSKYVREWIPAPHPERQEAEFIDLLIKQAGRLGGSMIVPASDETLVATSRHKARLENHYIVACTDWTVTQKFIDKKYTYALADAIGVPAPRTMVPHSEDDVDRYSRSVEFPCLVKPCQSHSYFDRFRRKMVRVDNLEQMIAAYREAADAGLETMLQEFIPGGDAAGINYNSYFWDGRPLVDFTAEKVRNAPPQYGSPRVAVSKRIPEVLEPACRLLKAMDFYGFSCAEFKRDSRDGIYKLMEVNGRHNRSGLLALRCGINFPWIQYQHLVYGHQPDACDFETGVYWMDFFRDLSYSLKSFRQEGYSLGEYLLPYRRPHVDALYDRDDPRPFFRRAANLVKRGL